MTGHYGGPALERADRDTAALVADYPHLDVPLSAQHATALLGTLSALRGRSANMAVRARLSRLCAVAHGVRGRARLDLGDTFGAGRSVQVARDLAGADDRALHGWLCLLAADVRLADDNPQAALDEADAAWRYAETSRLAPLAAATVVRCLARLARVGGDSRTYLDTLTRTSRVADLEAKADLPAGGPVTLTSATRTSVGCALVEGLSWLPNAGGTAERIARDHLPTSAGTGEYGTGLRLSLACSLADNEPEMAAAHGLDALSQCALYGAPSAPARARIARLVKTLPAGRHRRDVLAAVHN